MTTDQEQQFLQDLEKKLWNAADKLRSTLDAANYKHTVLGLVFLKYVSDAFDIRRAELEAQLKDPEQDYFLDPDHPFGGICSILSRWRSDSWFCLCIACRYWCRYLFIHLYRQPDHVKPCWTLPKF